MSDLPEKKSGDDLAGVIFGDRRNLLAEKLALMLIDLGGLTYEMAARDHFRLDVLVAKAAEIQAVDGELGQLDRVLSLGAAGAAGECPRCNALFARGAAFCAQCGFELMGPGGQQFEPHVAQPQT
ncbi:MAG: hypothetical protein QM648_06590 [Solirubrobacterales bacterium]